MVKAKSNSYEMKIDNLGRVVIPIEIRRQLGMETLEKVEATCDGTCVKFQKKDTTELDIKIRQVLCEAKVSQKLTNTDFEVLKEILGKLGS